MKLVARTAAVAGLMISSAAFAAAPILNVTKTVTIDASADSVWKVVKDFDGWNKWHPAVAKDEIQSGSSNEPGAVRLLTLGNGGTIKERLVSFDAKAHSFKYAIVESVLPVSNYSSTVTVKAEGDAKSVVTWSGHFKRKNVGDAPADNENDKTATDTISGVYQSGLDNLKKVVEAK